MVPNIQFRVNFNFKSFSAVNLAINNNGNNNNDTS